MDPTATLCTGAAERLNGVWDDSTRAHLEAAFRATGLPYAQRTSVLTAERLDRWAKDWTAAHEDTCAATAIRKEQSTEVQALRMVCLDRRRIEVEALVRRLNVADATIVERAVRAVEDLPPVAACADLGALTAVVPPPSDPARQAEIEQIERDLAEIEALRRTGDPRSIGARIAQLVARARAIGWRPLDASALFLDADVAGRIGVPAQEVEAKLHLAARAAAEARDDARLARAWSSLVGLLGNDPRRRADAELFEGYARAVLERLAVRAEAELDLASARCDRNVPSAAGADEIAEAARAEADCRDVIARAERIDPPRPETAAGALLRVAHFLRVQGKRNEARETILRAARWNEELFGAASPGVAHARHVLATSLLTEKKVDEAIAEFEAVLALRRVLYPDGGVKLGESLQGLGDALSSAPHPERALPYLREARDVFARAEGTTGVRAANAELLIAITLDDLGRFAEAVTAYDASAARRAQALGADHRSLHLTLRLAAGASLRLDRATQAVGYLEHAKRTLGEGEKLEAGEVTFALAQALVAEGRDLARARTLAGEARRLLVAAGESGAKGVAELDAWLRARRWR